MPNPGSPESMANQPQMPMMSNTVMITMMVFLIVALLVGAFRQQIGSALDVVFKVFAFPDKPMLSVLVVTLIAATLSTVIRGFMQNPIDMARTQQIQSDFNKEMRQARIENNLFKMKKLQEYQPQMMAATMEQTTSMMKYTMPISMIVFLPLATWLRYFFDYRMGSTYFSETNLPLVDTPWCGNVNLALDIGMGFIMYIVFYMMFCIVISMVEQRLIRYYLMNKALKEMPAQ